MANLDKGGRDRPYNPDGWGCARSVAGFMLLMVGVVVAVCLGVVS